jgi:hypothetical protein
MLKSPNVVTVSQLLLILNAAVWLVLGAWYLIPLFGEVGGPAISAWILTGLMLANALAMLLLAWGIVKRRRLVYYLALALILVNILLSVTDEFGPLDLVSLMLGLAILVLLVAGRRQYLPPASNDLPPTT